MQAEHQVDDELGRVAAADGAEIKHLLGKRVQERCISRRFRPVSDQCHTLSIADFPARTDKRAIDEANPFVRQPTGVTYGLLRACGGRVDDQGTHGA